MTLRTLSFLAPKSYPLAHRRYMKASTPEASGLRCCNLKPIGTKPTRFLHDGAHLPEFIDPTSIPDRYCQGLKCGYCGTKLLCRQPHTALTCGRCQSWIRALENTRRAPTYYKCQSKLLWKPVISAGYEPFQPPLPPRIPTPPPAPKASDGCLWYSLLERVRRETTPSLRLARPEPPPISRQYARFVLEGPRRGDGSYAQDRSEMAVSQLHQMLPHATEYNRVRRAFLAANCRPPPKKVHAIHKSKPLLK